VDDVSFTGLDVVAGQLLEAHRAELAQLITLEVGTAELRNAYGTGHGRSGSTVSGLHPRHARLVVGASATLASFLYETYEAIATD
jgi:hypothetical protein